MLALRCRWLSVINGKAPWDAQWVLRKKGEVMLGERLRVARARAKLSMADVAKACDCTAQAVKKWEHDESMPDSRKFLKLCGLLDVSAEWLMDATPLDFHSTEQAPQGRHAKYWAREAIAEMRELGLVVSTEQ